MSKVSPGNFSNVYVAFDNCSIDRRFSYCVGLHSLSFDNFDSVGLLAEGYTPLAERST